MKSSEKRSKVLKKNNGKKEGYIKKSQGQDS